MLARRSIRPIFEPSEELRARLLRRAQHLCRGTFDAEDLVQEVLTAFVARSRAGTLDPQHSMDALLFRALMNAFISRLRKADAEERYGASLPTDEESTPPPSEPPELELWELVTGDDMKQALEGLSPKQREVYVAVTRGGGYAVIAEGLGISQGAVGKRVFDARRNLSQLLRDILARRGVILRKGPPGS
ncbi:MAG TPA: RNA polymerase sigma factor [Myxococcaceae bacterium]|jgi:RNA polymerase sigma factor (sigma-70 family)